jgi:hypothetical protein
MSILVEALNHSNSFHPAASSDARRIPAESKSRNLATGECMLPRTESPQDRVACREVDDGIGFGKAGVLASASPLGIMAMGAFPLSLVGFGKTRFWDW